jgi:homocysteine S-methyltransferase
VELLRGFNEGHDGLGHEIGQKTSFQIGVAVNPNAEDPRLEAQRLRRKISAGAHFVMTQPLYESEQLWRFLELTGELPVPLVVGVMPLVSHRQAEYLHHEVPGIAIPDALRARMADASDGEAEGIAMAQSFMAAVRTHVAGFYLVPSYNRVEPLLPLLELVPSMRG